MNSKTFTFIDIFHGMGGFSFGFLKAGFEHLFGIDNWHIACRVYKLNIGDSICIDANNFMKSFTLKSPDVIIGSPPCQSFSRANTKNRICDLSLINSFIYFVNRIKPKIWIMENVPEIYDYIHAPYKYLFDMSEYGILQQRKRCFCSNVPLDILPTKNKYISEIQTDKLLNFRENVIHRKYQTITNRYNSFIKTTPYIKDEYGIRLINHEEALSLQTYPFYYQIPYNIGQRNIETLIGNSVPPAFSYKLALKTKEHLDNNVIGVYDNECGIDDSIKSETLNSEEVVEACKENNLMDLLA